MGLNILSIHSRFEDLLLLGHPHHLHLLYQVRVRMLHQGVDSQGDCEE
jgi:hypothetical protein